MPWWLWILTVLAGLVVVFFTILIVTTPIDRWLSQLVSKINFSEHHGADTGLLIIYLPGILADGDDSSKPVRETWLKYGDVLTVSYNGDQFDANHVIKTVVMRLRADVGHDKFVFIGSSMGGLLAVDIVDQFRQAKNTATIKMSSIVFVDSPSGSRDMLAGGNIAAPILRLMPFGRVSNRPGALVMRMMMVPPKDENIEAGLDHDMVKRKAIKSMSKYPLSIWRDQLAYMAAHRSLSPSNFSDLDQLVYLRCDRNNETVKQPQAAETWRSAARGLLVIGVDSTHCGYLERPSVWNQSFEQVLKNMARVH